MHTWGQTEVGLRSMMARQQRSHPTGLLRACRMDIALRRCSSGRSRRPVGQRIRMRQDAGKLSCTAKHPMVRSDIGRLHTGRRQQQTGT